MLEANQYCQRCLKAPKVLLRFMETVRTGGAPFKH